MDEQTIARFRSKVDQRGPDECWPWKGARRPKGYGAFYMGPTAKPQMAQAHRVAFFIRHGRWPEPCGLHSCDNPPCCNDAHIFEGTNQANVDDRNAKGRTARGDRAGPRSRPERRPRGQQLSHLSEAQVRHIRKRYAEGESQGSIARRLGITQPCVSRIVHRVVWGHVP